MGEVRQGGALGGWRRAPAPLALALLLATLPAAPVVAHKLNAFAFVDGETIEGSVYFAGNVAARAVPVRLFAPDGALLAETVTDAQGRFRVAAARRIDHRVVALSGDGHRAEWVITAAELPASLAGGDDAPAAAPSPAPSPAPAAAPAAGEIEGLVERAVARQLGPLREQIDRFEQQIRLRDVLGGAGYILGLTGLAVWLYGRRR